MRRGILLTAAIVLLSVLVFRWWLPAERVITPTVSLPDTRLDYRLQDFTARFHDEAGRPELEISGPNLEHDAESRQDTITGPEFAFMTADSPWMGQAQRGEFDREMDTLELINEVEVWREQAEGPLRFTTERLQHQRPARTISADVPVLLTQPGARVEAGGLMIQLDSETVNLTNEVHLHARTANHRD
ncbi:MAG: LPS export ABC transporter periplasmic protein LptC [Pseudomonadota bacterium]